MAARSGAARSRSTLPACLPARIVHAPTKAQVAQVRGCGVRDGCTSGPGVMGGPTWAAGGNGPCLSIHSIARTQYQHCHYTIHCVSHSRSNSGRGRSAWQLLASSLRMVDALIADTKIALRAEVGECVGAEQVLNTVGYRVLTDQSRVQSTYGSPVYIKKTANHPGAYCASST